MAHWGRMRGYECSIANGRRITRGNAAPRTTDALQRYSGTVRSIVAGDYTAQESAGRTEYSARRPRISGDGWPDNPIPAATHGPRREQSRRGRCLAERVLQS